MKTGKIKQMLQYQVLPLCAYDIFTHLDFISVGCSELAFT